MTDKLPKRLKADAILEAVLEVRFEADPSLVPEVFFGRLIDAPEWKEFKYARLPTADIPAAIRRSDPNFMYQPSIEMTSQDGLIAFRMGPHAVSYSRRGSYPGWSVFRAELETMVSELFRVIPKAKVTRIGLRYINALRSDIHGISSINDLAISISLAGENLSNGLNLNFKSAVEADFETLSRIASVDFAEGNIPENATVIIDIDAHTSPSFSCTDATAVNRWVDRAHDVEKESFFRLLGNEVTERLREA